MTTCELLSSSLSAFLDGECEPAEESRVRVHLKQCYKCSERAARWRDIGAAMRSGDSIQNVFVQKENVQNPSTRFLEAVRAEEGRVSLNLQKNIQNSAPRGRSILQFPSRRNFAAAALVAATILASLIFFSRTSAGDDIRAILALENENRAEAASQRSRIDAVRFEIAALRQRARAAKLQNQNRESIENDTKKLLEKADGLERRLAAVVERLEREGVLTKLAGARRENTTNTSK